MKVFEFHFNPDSQEDAIFDSFCYDPANIDERRLGNLYAIGEIKNTLPQNYKLLERLSTQIKKEYYLSSLRSPEKALTEGLKKGNEFLEGLTKKGDVSWMGNLNFAVLSIKDFVFHFTKVEKIFFYFIRNGKVINITQKLIGEEINPYPLKVFGNVVSGKLTNDDILIILTKEVNEIFTSEKLFGEIASLTVFTEKKLKEILGLRDKKLKEISGAALLISLANEAERPTKGRVAQQTLQFNKPKERFSLVEALSPILKIFKWIFSLFKKILWQIPHPRINLNIPALKLHIFSPKVNRFKPAHAVRKNFVVIGAFVFVLAIGFIWFQFQSKKDNAQANASLESIQNKNTRAQQLLQSGDKKAAGNLFLVSWNELDSLIKNAPITVNNSSFKGKTAELKTDIETNLYQITNFKNIENPELLFDFSTLKPQGNEQAFAPQNLVKMGNEIYFFNPAIQNLFDFDLNSKTGKIIKKEQKFNFGFPLSLDVILFFTKPDNIIYFKAPDQFTDSKLQLPEDYDIVDFKTNFSNLYLLDKTRSSVFKCPYKIGASEQTCQDYFVKNNTKNPSSPVSLSVDGSLWVLNQDGTIDRYWSGVHNETIKLSFFPQLEKPTKIYTVPGLPYLYILDPLSNRILIFTKTGDIVEQFQSKKFDNIKDIAVSNDGKIIYLLNGLSLYKINF